MLGEDLCGRKLVRIEGCEEVVRGSLRLLIVGDSSAAGVGVTDQRHALAGYLSQALARHARARVRWKLVAQSGLTSAECLRLLETHPPLQADIVLANILVDISYGVLDPRIRNQG